MSVLQRSRIASGLHNTRLGLKPVPLLRVSSTAGSRGRRDFHLSSFAGGLVDYTAQTLSTVHQAGLPWYMTIPLLAVAVNFTVILPVGYCLRTLTNKRAELSPFKLAWNVRHQAATPPRPDVDRQSRLLKVSLLNLKTQRRLYKTWGCQLWKTFSILPVTFAPFLLVTEALRQMSGAPVSYLAGFLVQARHAVSSHTSSLFESSLAHGGTAWFVDLTAMDPYFILPLLCSGLLIRQLAARLTTRELRAVFSLDKRASNFSTMQRIQLAALRALFIMPLLPLVFADLPSAIFLYWGTAFGIRGVNAAIVDRLLPKQPDKMVMPKGVPMVPRFLRGPESTA